MGGDDSEKSEEPTAKRQSESRQKGQVARSSDLSSAVSLLLGVLALWFTKDTLSTQFQGLTLECFRATALNSFTEGDLMYYSWSAARLFLMMLAPVVVVLLAGGIFINWLQVGLLWTTYPLQPNLGKVFSPANYSRLVSTDRWVELFKSILKMILVSIVAYQIISSHFSEMLVLVDADLSVIIARLLDFCLEMGLKCGILLFILGCLDFYWQKYNTHQKMKMSKQEVKDEARMSEGDPKVRGKIKQLRAQMHQKFMMKEVPKATVVITNPTFIAIAIRYQPLQDTAPVVVAKGKRLIAERIRDLARENGVPLVENKPLARGLYDIIEVGEPIPQEFFAPVAEILAYVYRMDKKHQSVPA